MKDVSDKMRCKIPIAIERKRERERERERGVEKSSRKMRERRK